MKTGSVRGACGGGRDRLFLVPLGQTYIWQGVWRKRMGIEPTPDAETGTGQRF